MTKKHVLLTGGLGFIGGHSVEHWLRNTDWDITVLDSMRFAGRVDRLTDIESYDPDRVRVLWHDLRSELHSRLMYQIGDVDYIVNMASDSHVGRSIDDPVPFIHNNVMSTVNMLEYAHKVKPEKFIQISTDEVFGPAPIGVDHKEDAPLKPSNPYSASKAAQEQIAYAYWRTYDVPVVITNTMNNFGEKQDPEKWVPIVIKRIMAGDIIQVHAQDNGDDGWVVGSRVWLHARNHADALMFILNEIEPAQYGFDGDLTRFNVAGEVEKTNLEIVETVGAILGIDPVWVFEDFHSSRPGHDLRYSLDGSKIRESGWVAPMDFDESFRQTVEWSVAHPEWLDHA